VIREASASTRVLLLHAPYPGRLKFDGQPTSLLCAAGPLVRGLASEGRLDEVGYLDPRAPTPDFYGGLDELAAAGSLRVVCISTSTAAIEEAARAAAVVRASNAEVLILAGGPHEDDCEEPMALCLPDVDISVAGDAEDVLSVVARGFLDGVASRGKFLQLLPDMLRAAKLRGRARIAGRTWGTLRLDSGSAAPPPNELLLRPWTDRTLRFDIFGGRETLPLMVSRGCAYGRCSFCAEAAAGGQLVASEFSHLEALLASRPRAALYFQDSIFPASRRVREQLLPMLRDSGRPWGCQLYLPALSADFVDLLAKSGCVYAYTGIESGSEAIRAVIGKAPLRDGVVYGKLSALASARMRLGISLIFGSMDSDGRLVETERTIEQTEALAERLVGDGMDVAGFYPNVLTVLPGTALARGLAHAGAKLDFFRMPRVPAFAELEDGGVGYNFASLPGRGCACDGLVERIAEASRMLSALGRAERPQGRENSHASSGGSRRDPARSIVRH
jgi:radical SAM superfamily enzyme YgiQ (UPF0313 family)